MGTATVFNLSEFLHIADGVVVSSAWTDDHCRELLRSLRLARAAAPDDLGDPVVDVAVAARIFHEVLDLHPTAQRWPVFAGGRKQQSLFKCAVLHAVDGDDPGAAALLRVDDDEALLAANVARWMLRLPQQTSSTLVFATPPPSGHRVPKPRVQVSHAKQREPAVA
jgi:hypothetical protein